MITPMLVGIDNFSAITSRYTDIPFERCRVVRTYSGINLLNKTRRTVLRQKLTARDLLSSLDAPPRYPRVDLMHLFNTVSLGLTPWVVTFEHELPRWNRPSSSGVALLLRRSCRRLLVMSAWAFAEQLRSLERYPQWKELIRAKMSVLHPPQAASISSYDEKTLPVDRLVCTFVGRAFFRKGGLESVLAVTKLVREGLPVHLNVISSINPDDNPTPVSPQEVDTALRLIQALGPAVTHFHDVPNEEVLALLRASHVSLLPTTCDTYGFSVLESQACGTPVITTEQRAMPEINSDAVGWRIPAPLDERGNVLVATPEQRSRFTEFVVEQLCDLLREILRTPGVLRARGTRALEQIRREFSPVDRARQLESIYEQALRPDGDAIPA